MRKSPFPKMLLGLVGLVVLAGLLYQLPPVNQRLSWRLDFAMTYLRSALQPAGDLPTPLPQPRVRTTSQSPALAELFPLSSSTPPALTPLTPEPTPTPSASPTPIPRSVSIPPPAWEKQGANNCGPATLAMYMRFYGWKGDQYEIADVVKPVPADRNVNVEELASYVSTQVSWLGFQYRVGGDLSLLKKFLAAGFPVMVEEGMYLEETYWPGDDHWAAHYNLLTGYDDIAQVFTAQDSFRGPDRKVPYKDMDEFWQSFNRVYILIYPAEKEAAIQSILGTDWDVDANRQHAMQVAQAATQSDPENAYAWFNLGTNLVYFERYDEAAEAYDQARELGLPQRMLRYQFGPFFAYFNARRIDDLIALTDYALKRTPNSEEARLWRGWALYRSGDTNGAIEQFNTALKDNWNYQDAKYALNFVQENPRGK